MRNRKVCMVCISLTLSFSSSLSISRSQNSWYIRYQGYTNDWVSENVSNVSIISIETLFVTQLRLFNRYFEWCNGKKKWLSEFVSEWLQDKHVSTPILPPLVRHSTYFVCMYSIEIYEGAYSGGSKVSTSSPSKILWLNPPPPHI